MRDKTEEEIINTIKRIKEKFADKDVYIIQSYEPANKEGAPLVSLSNSIKLLATADLVYFVKGWNKARGCRIECMCALEYGIPVKFEEEICEDLPKE